MKKIIDTTTIDWHINVIKHLGADTNKDIKILDIGCGNGGLIKEYLAQGYAAFGCDVSFEVWPDVASLIDQGIVRLINLRPYHLPFEDNSFDYIYSNHVIEHVAKSTFPSFLSEISRVLKPGGYCFHVFPSKYQLYEGHLFIPFGGFFRPYWWILLWALLGIRKKNQKGQSAVQVAKFNQYCLKNKYNHMTKHKLRKEFLNYFSKVIFCEDVMIRYAPKKYWIKYMTKIFPFIPYLVSAMWNRAVVCVKEK